MARDSLAAAKAEVFGLVSAPDGTPLITGIASAYDHDPGPGALNGPISVTVRTAGLTPEHFVLLLTIFADRSSDPAGIQSVLDDAILAHEQALYDWFGPFEWQVEPHPDDPNVLVASRLVHVLREDTGWSRIGA